MDFRIYHVCFKRIINHITQLSMRLKNAENGTDFIVGHNNGMNKPYISEYRLYRIRVPTRTQ